MDLKNLIKKTEKKLKPGSWKKLTLSMKYFWR